MVDLIENISKEDIGYTFNIIISRITSQFLTIVIQIGMHRGKNGYYY